MTSVPPSLENGEDAIRRSIASIEQAMFNKDAAAVTGQYAPGVVICNLAPPLIAEETDDPSALQAWLDGWQGPLHRTTRDLRIHAGDTFGFAWSLVNISTRDGKSGEPVSFWFRETLCFRNGPGGWEIVHEHSSVPFYMDGSERAAIDLTPEND